MSVQDRAMHRPPAPQKRYHRTLLALVVGAAFVAPASIGLWLREVDR
jgi:hypothetical protein